MREPLEPSPCQSGKTQAPWLQPEILQRLAPAKQCLKNCWQQCTLPTKAATCLSRENINKYRHLSSAQRICRSSCQQSHTRKAAGCSAHSLKRATGACLVIGVVVCPTSEKHKIQDPCQWPCEGSCQWHSLHIMGARRGPLIHILIFRATKSTLTSSRTGGQIARSSYPAAIERACGQ